MIQTPCATRSSARASRWRASAACSPSIAVEGLAQRADALALRAISGSVVLRRVEQLGDEVRAETGASALDEQPGVVGLGVERRGACPRPNSALSSNSELAQAGPRPAALTVHGVVGRLPP